ncbi:hypothetical protein [Actinomadura violacea]|uniref:HNH endonuclease n=1 Tax=Actinomadura violacea TaxID=2819934 RepID=A0ABS3RXY7_9ACTN|nr:hypothetical protein [Actinomadura violacea]MBO2461617.1 hypothetical protein [Actinomadura violacea]
MSRRILLEEHEQNCPACGHQNGVHCGGGPPRTGADGDWAAMYDDRWLNASGTCRQLVDTTPADATPAAAPAAADVPADEPPGSAPVGVHECGCTARTRLQAVRR